VSFGGTNDPLTNTPLLKGRLRSDNNDQTRQQKRHRLRVRVAGEISGRFAGSGRGGNLQWPPELCPRRRRRDVVHVKARRLWQEGNRIV